MARCNCSVAGNACVSQLAGNILFYDGQGCLAAIPQTTSDVFESTLTTAFDMLDVTVDDWHDVPTMVMTLPGPGLFDVEGHSSGVLHMQVDAGTSPGTSYTRIESRLYNVTAGTDVPNSRTKVTSGGIRPVANTTQRMHVGGAATSKAFMQVTGSTIVQLQARILVSPSGTATIDRVQTSGLTVPETHMRYRRIA
jgi:hypothetical protein